MNNQQEEINRVVADIDLLIQNYSDLIAVLSFTKANINRHTTAADMKKTVKETLQTLNSVNPSF